MTEDVGGTAGDDLDLSAGGEVDAGRAGADGLEQRWIWLLHRFGQHPHVVNAGEFAVIGESLFSPGFDDDVDSLLEPFAAGVDVHPHAFELLALVTGADAEVDAAAAYYVQHGHFLGHQHRVM